MADSSVLGLVAKAGSGVMDFSIGVGSTVVSYKEAYRQARYAEANATLQRDMMEYNRRMELHEADTIEAEGNENARRMREAAALARSQRIAMLGKSGVAMSSGSPLAVLAEAAGNEETQIQDRRYAASRQAAQHRNRAADYAYGSKIAALNIRAARSSRPTATSFALGIGSAAVKSFM